MSNPVASWADQGLKGARGAARGAASPGWRCLNANMFLNYRGSYRFIVSAGMKPKLQYRGVPARSTGTCCNSGITIL